MTRPRERAKKARRNLKKSHHASATVIGGTILPDHNTRLLRLSVDGSELSVTGYTDGRWTLIVTHRSGWFELEFLETEGGGRLCGEGATLAEAVEVARGLDPVDRTEDTAHTPRGDA